MALKPIKFINLKKQNHQGGSIIIYTLLILFVVLTISLALMRLLVPKFRTVKESVYSTVSLYAADSGMEWCIFSNRTDPAGPMTVPAQPASLNTIQSVTIQYYDSGNSPTVCPYNSAIGFRTVGTYRGISRSLEVF